jgi:hypothetical protein
MPVAAPTRFDGERPGIEHFSLESREQCFVFPQAASQQIVEMVCLRHAGSKVAVEWIGITFDHPDALDEVAQNTGGTYPRQAAANHDRIGHQVVKGA